MNGSECDSNHNNVSQWMVMAGEVSVMDKRPTDVCLFSIAIRGVCGSRIVHNEQMEKQLIKFYYLWNEKHVIK